MNNDFNPFKEGWEPNPLDVKIEELKDLLRAEVDEQTTHQLDYDKKLIEIKDNEIKKLKNKVSELSKELKDAKSAANDDIILAKMGKILKERIDQDNIRKFIELLYKRDDSEFHENVDVELMCNYYSHKDDILALIDFFNLPRVNNIENFRLPTDYTEEEVALIIKNIANTSNCNGTYYKDNLKFSTSSLLNPITSVRSFDNFMWQYFLRNPYVLNHLEEIADNVGYSRYFIFAQLDRYQELNDDQKKILIEGLIPEMFKRKNDNKEWQEFALRNIHLIEDNQIFIQLAANLDPYDIRYNRRYVGFPEHIRKTLYDKLTVCELCEMVKDDKATAKDKLEILDYINKKMELKAELEDTIDECI